MPVRLSGKVSDNKDVRLSVEADLTSARIENLLPGWVKPERRKAHATFTVITRDKTTRFEDIAIDGAGVNVRGHAELDDKGDLASANFPVFALSDGDKGTNVKAERGADNALRVSLRGDVYDGRSFVKNFFGGEQGDKPKSDPIDLDFDMRLGAIAGHNGEALRGVEMRMSRRNGQIRTFALNSGIGQNATFTGEMRASAQRRNVLHFETHDAGSLMRFTDTYPRIHGGQMSVAMDVPTPDQAPQDGIVNIQNFSVRGEPKLNGVIGGSQNDSRGIDFTRMRVDFTRTPGRLQVKEGIVQGPVIGATLEGNIDFARNDVRMRGTIVPLYGINNPIGQLPLLGAFLGGPKEGLFGFTYQVVGPPSAPSLNVNPASGLVPGFLRKFFEYPTARPLEPAEAAPVPPMPIR